MLIGNTEITRQDMPSYELGKNYPSKRWSYMQDTLSNALNRNMAQGNVPVQTQPVGTNETSSMWGGGQQQ